MSRQAWRGVVAHPTGGHRTGRGAKRGLTLIEVLIVCFIMSVLGAGVARLFQIGTNAETNTMNPNIAGAAARQGLDILCDHIRDGSVMTKAAATDLTFTDTSGNADRYWFSGGKLLTSTNGSPAAGTTVLSNVTALAFTFWYWNGTTWVSGIPATISTIGTVDISITTSMGSDVYQIASSVRMREAQ